MPEGDTIFRAARTLNRALAGQVVTGFETQLPRLARVDYDSPLTGRAVERVDSAGKWMRMYFSHDLVLLTHMLMSGSWHIYRPSEGWQRPSVQMRIALYTAAFTAVAFNVQIAEFHTAATLARHRSVRRLGPDVLGIEFDESAAADNIRACPHLEIGEALLKQSLISGLGNVFKSEVCFASGVNPMRRVASLTDVELLSLMQKARQFLLANISSGAGSRRTTGRDDPAANLWVYKRKDEPCRRCGTGIVSYKQGEDARVTFWCPACQPI